MIEQFTHANVELQLYSNILGIEFLILKFSVSFGTSNFCMCNSMAPVVDTVLCYPDKSSNIKDLLPNCWNATTQMAFTIIFLGDKHAGEIKPNALTRSEC